MRQGKPFHTVMAGHVMISRGISPDGLNTGKQDSIPGNLLSSLSTLSV